jgi:Spy/CpxP family protein refolding chaperone
MEQVSNNTFYNNERMWGMKTRSLLMGLVAGMLLLAPVSGFCAEAEQMGPPPGVHEGKGEGRHFEKTFDALGLSAEQKDKLKAGREKNRDVGKQAREEIRNAREALGQELDKPTLDVAKVKALHETLKTLILKGEDRRLDMILEVRAIMTPEQFAAFQKIMKESRSKMHKEGRWEGKREGKRDGKREGKRDGKRGGKPEAVSEEKK